MSEFGERWCEFPRLESWKIELFISSVQNMVANFETFRDDYQDSDAVREALKTQGVAPLVWCECSTSGAGTRR